jgi:hypothetical protein
MAFACCRSVASEGTAAAGASLMASTRARSFAALNVKLDVEQLVDAVVSAALAPNAIADRQLVYGALFHQSVCLAGHRIVKVEAGADLEPFDGFGRVVDLPNEVLRRAVHVVPPNQRQRGACLNLRNVGGVRAANHAVTMLVHVPERRRERDHLALTKSGQVDGLDVLALHASNSSL